jgi:hypothetical protein
MDICGQYRKRLFLYCCIYIALHSNGSYPIIACVFVVRECVYRVVAQQRVLMSQYISLYWPCNCTIRKYNEILVISHLISFGGNTERRLTNIS